MKNLLLITLLCVASAVHGQKTKSLSIYSDPTNKLHVRGIVSFNESNVATDTSYYLSVMDDRYTAIYESVILTRGTLQDIYSFIKAVHYAINTEDMQTTVTISGCRVHVCKILGLRSGMIYDPAGTDGYGCYDHGKLYGAMKGIEKYCTKRGIKLENLFSKDDFKK